VSSEDLSNVRASEAVHARAAAFARELNLPADASRAQLMAALAASRIVAPSLRTALDDTRDLEDVLIALPSGGLKVPPKVGWRATVPQIPSRKPRYHIRVRAVFCADDDGTNGATITKNQVLELLKVVSTLYFHAGLTFALSAAMPLTNTMINQDFTVPTGLDMTVEDPPPMTAAETNVSFDKHNAERTAWARNYPGELVIFFRRGTKLEWNKTASVWEVRAASFAFSGPEHEFVAMGQGSPPEVNLLAHESGHYFHLNHTFNTLVTLTAAESKQYPNWETSAADRAAGLKILRERLAEGIRTYIDDQNHPADQGLEVLNGDGLIDTPPDPAPPIFRYGFANQCDTHSITVDVNLASGPRSYTVVAPHDIIMSYFFRCAGLKRYSESQIDVVRTSLEQATFTGTVKTTGGAVLPILSRHHLIAPKYKMDGGNQVAVPPKFLTRAAQRLRSLIGLGRGR